MSAARPFPEITRAAERYLEQIRRAARDEHLSEDHGPRACAPSVSRSQLSSTESQKALASMHPMIVRINDVGRAEAIDYRNFQYRPQEAENKYYLSRWAELYFSRNRFTIERDQTNALYFLNGDVQRAVIDQERKDNFIQTYRQGSGASVSSMSRSRTSFSTTCASRRIRHGLSSKRCSRILRTTPKLKRERWTASVTYVFRENVKNNELAVNPLGLTIVRFRADQAFS